MEETYHKIIIPKRLIYKKQLYQITKFDRKYIINNYRIQTTEGLFLWLFVDSPHPNVSPKTNIFCTPSQMNEEYISNKFLFFIETLLSTFNADDCYFTPWGEIEYEKMVVGEFNI